jgi:hypothetical protein
MMAVFGGSLLKSLRTTVVLGAPLEKYIYMKLVIGRKYFQALVVKLLAVLEPLVLQCQQGFIV